ncbi:fructosamine kinase family protein [Cyanobium sp. ATX 6A2]|uniref:fructosamine kinase family protein n=1 Tax=Cyanobium sp. ATX 6A2 TaxID=2823700 RepID=UPI0020CCF752|nr:fructosamine kinase family protein [Cyanobium sp. ATX 6A2]
MTASTHDLLAPWLAERLGLTLQGIATVSGGCIHRAWCLRLDGGERLFAKTNQASALPMFEAEAAGLRALARWAQPPLQVPMPLAVGLAGSLAVLVLPWLELQGGAGDHSDDWRQLGRALAELHRCSRGGQNRGFGFEADNFIGSAPQANAWHAEWAPFFAACRLAPQFSRAAAAGRPLRGAAQLLAELPAWLGSHACEPVLVHGDLWSGNAALLAGGGGGALFDPASHWADREVDLAMVRLFGGFPQAFFAGYEDVWTLPHGAAQRLPLYNLYHLLNHANLFGGSYWSQSQASLDALLRAGPPG